MRALVLAAALAAMSAAALALPAPERVSFPSLDKDASGKPVEITGLFYRPETGAAAPLVIAIHGCGGMYSASPSKRDELALRGIAWTEKLLSDGYAVLWPDSFNPRGRRSVCLVKRGEPSIPPSTRRLDILGAVAYAATRPEVDRARVALLGGSHGGSTTLASINGKDADVAAFFAAPGAPPRLRAAVAFYPGCGVIARTGDAWLPAVPLEIHIGALDDWSAPSWCEKLAASARARGADMTLTVYPGAYHGFDGPAGKVTVWKDVTTGVNPGEGVHVGPDPAARAAAETAVRKFLVERLAP